MFLNDLQNRLQLHAIPTLFPGLCKLVQLSKKLHLTLIILNIIYVYIYLDRRKDSTESVSFSKISTSTITESYNSNAILAHPLPASPGKFL